MKILNKYILKQIFIGFLLISFSLLAILWLTQSLRFVQLITNKGLPISLFIELTSLLMPRLFSLLSPIAAFAAVLFVYNRMLSDRELVIMKSAGISPKENAKAAIYFGVIMSAFGLYLNIWGIPQAEAEFNDLQWKVKNDVSHLMFKEGQFTEIQPNLTVFISSHETGGSMSSLLLNDERNPKTRSTISAEKGRIIYTDNGPRIILVNGIRQEISTDSNQFSSLSFKRYSVDLGYDQNKKEKSETAREKTTWELLNADEDKTLDEDDIRHYKVTGHNRLINPFYNLLFALIGCVGLIVGNFNRRGQTKIISISIVAMVIIQALSIALDNMCSKNLNLLPLLYLNLIIPLGVSIYILLNYNASARSHRRSNGEKTNEN